MGVKLPESATGEMVGLAVAAGVPVTVGVGVGVGVSVGLGVGVGVGVNDADGVDSKAGPSAAWTTKVRVKVLKIP